MHLYIFKSWLRKRWHVYMKGDLDGDWIWLATFASAADASEWVHEQSGSRGSTTAGEAGMSEPDYPDHDQRMIEDMTLADNVRIATFKECSREVASLPRYRDDDTGMQPHESGEWLRREDVLRALIGEGR